MKLLAFGIFALYANILFSQNTIDPSTVTIIRDSYGVPHIHAPTDAGVAYGLAYAHAEDDFFTLQEMLLAASNRLAENTGKAGAGLDFVAQFLDVKNTVDKQYDTDFRADFKAILSAYTQALNKYAATHPKEVRVKGFFPIHEKQLVAAQMLANCLVCGIDKSLKEIVGNRVDLPKSDATRGSNAYAINAKRTIDNKPYFCSNTHMPLEGSFGWYEAHLTSDEGLNIAGALFPLSPVILLGANENIAWTHTINKTDLVDVYQLEINPDNPDQYKLDDKWVDLEKTKAHFNVKIPTGIKLGVNKHFYKTKFGSAFRNKQGVFAVRLGAMFRINALQQWYDMNKAKNYTQFRHILDEQSLARMNIVYADKKDTIYYIDNGLFPIRKEGYNWLNTVKGTKSDQIWNTYYPIKDLPQILQPQSGYVFNTNNTPFDASGKEDNVKRELFPKNMGLYPYDNNRSKTFQALMQSNNKFTYAQFKELKYSTALPQGQLYFDVDINAVLNLDPEKYPDIKDQIMQIKTWNRESDTANTDAALMMIIARFLIDKTHVHYDSRKEEIKLKEEYVVEAFGHAKKFLQKYHHTTKVPLGNVQRHIRGNVSIASDGQVDVLRAATALPYKKGVYRIFHGDSYLLFVKFTDGLPELESISPYGASNHKDSKHYTDQMRLYTTHKTKKIYLDKNKVLQDVESKYSPK